ncbi:rhamnulokinase family protein [Kibdelosporangium persicum]|uniref:Carbohydrate kinase n=1 Tax=Kibdelosporangium persicum TaxID=2698649 RepID=A0ABX2F741_9PSEU|nr:rhamnulokinase family protein [Kibdelosporangium persicum]NRN67174.1 Carbohydrate kinase [Kibdelosporangium persicum]
MRSFVAVDLGASSGRVMLGHAGSGPIELEELHRFAIGPQSRPGGGLRWDIAKIHAEAVHGIRAAAPADPVSIGLDSWAVDYGLVDADGKLDGDVRCYRDPRTQGVRSGIDDRTLYGINGLQHLPFNTIYQLLTEPPERLADHTMLLVPDLLGYLLTGVMGAEVTNASTTGLLSASTRSWSTELLARSGIPASLLPPLRQPGEHIGLYESTPVVAVASHDTASAVAAIPATTSKFGYISCGTWSLAGLRLDAPVLTEQARLANFTNESGVDGTTRFLRNTMGLWLLSESLRVWNAELAPLLSAAAAQPAFAAVIDPNDDAFLAPGDIPARIAGQCRRTGQPPPATPAAFVRTILESLALAHAATLQTAAALAGRDLDVVHLVGGGARNELLCQFTADACGLPVLAGPVEASATGNVLVQARAAGVHAEPPPPFSRYEPSGDRTRWLAAARRIALPLS